MKKYVCDVCGYIYDPAKGDPDNGIDPGTAFETLPDDWVCPECGASKEDFSVQVQCPLFTGIKKICIHLSDNLIEEGH